MHGADAAPFQALRAKMEAEWTPQMMKILDIDKASLPIIWDADFLYGPRTPIGRRQLGVVRNQRELGIRDPRPGTSGHRTLGTEQVAQHAKRMMAWPEAPREGSGWRAREITSRPHGRSAHRRR